MTTNIDAEDARRLVVLIRDIAMESYKEGLYIEGEASLKLVEEAVKLISSKVFRLEKLWTPMDTASSVSELKQEILDKRTHDYTKLYL